MPLYAIRGNLRTFRPIGKRTIRAALETQLPWPFHGTRRFMVHDVVAWQAFSASVFCWVPARHACPRRAVLHDLGVLCAGHAFDPRVLRRARRAPARGAARHDAAERRERLRALLRRVLGYAKIQRGVRESNTRLEQ